MATMDDIAKVVGVSKTTVTNALSGKANVSEAMRQRILQCARELGYRPNVLARSLAQRKTYTIGLVLPSIANPFYPEVAEAIENSAREAEYQTVLCTTHQNATLGRQQLERLVSRWVDGCIIMEQSMDLTDIRHYVHQGLPVVLCDWQMQEIPPEIPLARGDFARAGELAAQHLLELGHRELAVIVDEPGQALRLQGFRSVLEKAGIPFSQEQVFQGYSNSESGYQAAKSILARPQRPTAIFATTDLMAIGALDAIIDEGLRVPEDISLVGLDNIMVSTYVRPALTTICMHKEQLAREAVKLLFDLINGDSAVTTPVLVEPYLMVRQSTTIPRR